MKSQAMRIERLEKKAGYGGPQLDMIRICLVAPGPDGPTIPEPHSAHILIGANAGMTLYRVDGEDTEAFEARCDDLIGEAPCH